MSEDLIIIQKARKQNRQLQLVIALVLLIVGTGLFITAATATGGTRISLWIVGALFIGISLTLLAVLLKVLNDPDGRLEDILLHDPKKIVWVYHYIVLTMPFGIAVGQMTTMYFKLQNGDHLTLKVKPHVAEHLLSLLRMRLPHASFGYSAKKEFLYNTDPALLRR